MLTTQGFLLQVHFNPRAREGRDKFRLVAYTICVISIHAPARGATNSKLASIIFVYISIHAPARGATQETSGIFLVI